jgi:diaminopimelate epimerase
MPHPLAGRPILRMNGIGNEILVLDLRDLGHAPTPAEARAIACAPGLGYDQLMALLPARAQGADAAMRIYNRDGSPSAACGNGTRCVAYALARNGGQNEFLLETDAGLLRAWREAQTRFCVDMGPPRFDWREIPLAYPVPDMGAVALEPPVAGAPATFSAVGMGNPHAVFFVADAAAIDLHRLGPKLERHPLFPQRANISFAQILARDDIFLRVWERGTGATRACGSAACASLVAAARAGLAERRARLRLPGGDLAISWSAAGAVLMSGDVEFEFETRLDPAIFRGLRR